MRRTYLKGAIALFGALVLGFTSTAVFAQTQTIKISHQFPGGTIDESDFRDRLVRKFAAEVEKRTNGSLKFEIYPAASLMKAVPQYKALSTGALDMSLYPLAYAGGEFPADADACGDHQLRAGIALERRADRQGADATAG